MPPSASNGTGGGLPDIPELEKRGKEKKGGGIPWFHTAAPATSRISLGGGAAAKAGLPFGPARIAAVLAKALGPEAGVGGFFASSAGTYLVSGLMLGAGFLSVAGGIGLYLKASGPAGDASFSFPKLDGPSSDIRVRKPRDRSLDYLATANQGEVLFDPEHPLAPKPKEPSEKPKEEEPKDAPMGAPSVPDTTELMRQKFSETMGKLSSSIGGGQFGGPKGLGEGMGGFNVASSGIGGTVPKFELKQGRMKAFSRSKSPYSVKKMSTLRGRSNLAMGQLKLANALSYKGARTRGDEAPRSYSADAFDQKMSKGGEFVAGGGIAGGEPVVPPGSGLDPQAPVTGPGQNMTPYQSQIDSAKASDDDAAGLKNMGTMLIIIGILLIASGLPPLVIIGIMLLMMGMGMLKQSKQKGDEAKQQGDQVADQYGQKEQGGVVDKCSDEAVGSGTKPADCPAPKVKVDGRNTIQEDVRKESDAGFTLE